MQIIADMDRFSGLRNNNRQKNELVLPLSIGKPITEEVAIVSHLSLKINFIQWRFSY